MDAKRVFVVHGRNIKLKNAMVEFLRSIGLDPIEWDEAKFMTGKPMPYIGEILDTALSKARAVIVMMTPDDEAKLRNHFIKEDDKEHEKVLTPQPRLNVIYEAGMAMGKYPDRTVIVEFGNNLRLYSDISGIHNIRMDNSPERRQNLIDALKNAGADIGDLFGRTGYFNAGNFDLEDPVKEDIKGTNDSNGVINEPLRSNRIFDLSEFNVFHTPSGCRTSSFVIKWKTSKSFCLFVDYNGSNLPDYAGAFTELEDENWELIYGKGLLSFNLSYKKGELIGNTFNIELKGGDNNEVIGSYGVEIINGSMRINIPLSDFSNKAAKFKKMTELVFLFSPGLFKGSAEIEISNLVAKIN